MRKISYFAVLMALAVNSCVANERREDPKRDDGMINTFVISGAKLEPAVIDSLPFCTVEKLPRLPDSDSEYNVYSLGSGAVSSTKMSTVRALFPSATEFVIEGKTVSEKEFYDFPSSMLLSVDYNGGTLSAKSRANVNDSNPVREADLEGEAEFFDTSLNGVMPTDIVLGDPLTLPANGIVTSEMLIRSADAAVKKDYKKVALLRYGNRTIMSFDDSSGVVPSGSIATEVAVSSLKSLSVGDILAASNVAPNDVYAIQMDKGGDTVYVVRTRDLHLSAIMTFPARILAANGSEIAALTLYIRPVFDGDDTVRMRPGSIERALANYGYPESAIASIDADEATETIVVRLK